MPSKQSIEKYREIYRKQFEVDISVDDAAEQANRLLNLARVVLQPMPKAWERRYKELLREKREDRREFATRESKRALSHRLPGDAVSGTVAIPGEIVIITDERA
jgi:hypothetical protein